MKAMKNGLMVMMLLVILLLTSCVQTTETSNAGIQQKIPDKLASSVEQENINSRLQIVNSPTTTMWFYGLADTGQVIFKSTVKGKVTSSHKRLEPVQGTDTTNSYGHSQGSGGEWSSEIIQADGTFGQSDEYVFWFDYENNYYQWNGKYILTTKPLVVPPVMIDFQQGGKK